MFFVLGVFVDQTEDINDEVKTPQKENLMFCCMPVLFLLDLYFSECSLSANLTSNAREKETGGGSSFVSTRAIE